MNKFEFMNYNEKASVENDEEKELQGASSDFMEDVFCQSKKIKKLFKKEKKAKKTLSKQGKQLKKVASFGNELGKKVEALSDEVKAVKRDVAKFKKTARDSLFKELVYCDDISERKRLISEIQHTEVIE